jgi:cytochrome c-type biogenesis protein CcmH
MSIFLLLAVLMTAAALMFVLPALLRKSSDVPICPMQEDPSLQVLRGQLRELDIDLANGSIHVDDYAVARHELAQRVSEDVRAKLVAPSVARLGAPRERNTATMVALSVVALAAALYLFLGAPAGLDPIQRAAEQDQTHAVGAQQIEAMVTALALRLQTDPSNIEGWSMLARSYKSLGRMAAAADAYAHLVQLVPDDADLLTSYADTLATVQGNNLEGKPEELIQRALRLEPLNMKALALSGSAAFERKDYVRAIEQWQKILALLPAASEMRRSIESSIADARQGAAVAGSKPNSATQLPVSLKERTKGLSGTVTLDPALLSQLGADTTVFIFARAAQGSRRPLAVLRKQVKDLPFNFVLDDSMSMSPDDKLSDVDQLVVGARVSKTGNATALAGDWEGLSVAVSPGATGIKIEINSAHQ